MTGELSISVHDLVTWTPILISLIALYYSRKAMRRQLHDDRKKRVEAINLFVVENGLEIKNPNCLPLVRAKIAYHHRRRGTYSGEIDRSTLAPSQLIIDFLSGEWQGRQRKFHSGLGSGWLIASRELNLYDMFPRSKKVQAGYVVIAEMQLTDVAFERWYMNTAGVKLHIPRRVIPRAAFFVLLSLRLIGYPFWRRIRFVNWGNIVVASLLAVVAWDHYFNQGQFLLKALLALGARQI